jgi:hypothetical protein
MVLQLAKMAAELVQALETQVGTQNLATETTALERAMVVLERAPVDAPYLPTKAMIFRLAKTCLERSQALAMPVTVTAQDPATKVMAEERAKAEHIGTALAAVLAAFDARYIEMETRSGLEDLLGLKPEP